MKSFCELPDVADTLDACTSAAECFINTTNENIAIQNYNDVQKEKLRLALETWNNRKQTHDDDNSEKIKNKTNDLSNERRYTPWYFYFYGCNTAHIPGECGKYHPGWEYVGCHTSGTVANTSCKRSLGVISEDVNSFKSANVFEFTEQKPTQELYPLRLFHEVRSNILCCNNVVDLKNTNAANLKQICDQSVEQKEATAPVAAPAAPAPAPAAAPAPAPAPAPVAPVKASEFKIPKTTEEVIKFANENMIYLILSIILVFLFLII